MSGRIVRTERTDRPETSGRTPPFYRGGPRPASGSIRRPVPAF